MMIRRVLRRYTKPMALRLLLISAVALVGLQWLQLQRMKQKMWAERYPVAGSLECSLIEDTMRLQCLPDADSSESACVARGCCWREPTLTHSSHNNLKIGVPRCYFPAGYASYQLKNIAQTSYGYSATMVFNGDAAKFFRKGTVSRLSLNVYHYPKAGVVRVKISAQGQPRYEVPLGYPVHIKERPELAQSLFATRVTWNGLSVSDSNGRVLFDTNVHAPVIFADQFLQLSTLVNATLAYGLGEVQDQFAKPMDAWRQYSLFASSSQPNLKPHFSLSGVHPFVLLNRGDASSYGLFFANSNAMDIEWTPYPALTFRTIGGILDFYVYAGPTPADVVKQHLAVIGRPSVPPYWALGFHLSRSGYKSEANLQQVIKRNLDMGIPYDVQWLGADTLNKGQAWTYDQERFAHLADIVADLHARSMRVVVVVDPTVNYNDKSSILAVQATNPAVFVKDDSGEPFVGLCRAGKCVYTDFSAPDTVQWREAHARAFRSKVAWDGLWIDMNEPSNSLPKCNYNSLNNPEYVPKIEDRSLVRKTLCMSAVHSASTHYNLHNVYGHLDAKVTHQVIQRVLPGLRPFVLSRSTFAGTGRYAAHWTGDVASNWRHMQQSIIDVLNFNLFGIPFVGADVCGYRNNAVEELCIRWMQLGSFYPFMRNHNDFNSLDQDPAVWSDTGKAIMKAAVINRYELLPYLYTLLYRASLYGETVFRPLFFEFASDTATHTIQRQFMLGPAILVSPVLEAGVFGVNAYFPAARWYDKDGVLVQSSKAGHYETVHAPIERIPFFYRGGSIIPCQFAANNTELARQNNFFLIVALDDDQTATGDIIFDDGTSLTQMFSRSMIKFTAANNSLRSTVQMVGYVPRTYSDTLAEIRIFGVSRASVSLQLNARPVEPKLINFDALAQLLVITQLRVDLLEPFLLEW